MGLYLQRKISVRTLHKIMTCFCLDIDAARTAILADVNRNTANAHFRRFREAIHWYRTRRRQEKVGGEVEVDESYHGGLRRRGFHGKVKRGRGTSRQMVFGIYERDGEVFTELVPDGKKKTLRAAERFIREAGFEPKRRTMNYEFGKYEESGEGNYELRRL